MEIKTLVRLIAVVGSSLFAFKYICLGKMGIARYRALHHELAMQQQSNAVLADEVAALRQRLHAWNTDPFQLEKHAREELLLGGADEIVYLIK